MYDSQKKETQASSPETPSEGDVAKTFEVLAGTCSKELVDSVKGVFEFHLEGKEPGVWYLDLKNDSGEEIASLDTFHFSLLQKNVSSHRNSSLYFAIQSFAVPILMSFLESQEVQAVVPFQEEMPAVP